MASAYGYPDLYGRGDLGAGATVALYELEPFAASDISSYQSCYGTSATVNTTKVDGGAGTGPGSGESALDIEQVIGLAPRASLRVYEAPNTEQGAMDNYTRIITDDTSKVISTSFGKCESGVGVTDAQAENTIFQEAATQGQTIFAASGDSGAHDCTRILGATVDDPASQPFVTGAGGTHLTLSPRTEVVWNDGPPFGATGGGVSSFWPQPSYQAGAALPQSAISCATPATTTCREVPDVSGDADEFTGMVVFVGGSWTAFGGTSIVAPMWASLAALANASSACAGTSVGFANPALYRAAADGYVANFHDITSGNNSFRGVTGYSAEAGYDMTTGLGSPNAGALAPALCGDAVTVTSPGAQSSTTGTALSVAVKAASSANSALTYAAAGLPAGLTINSATGVISGTPTTAGSFTVTVSATDASGSTGDASFTWTTTAAPPPPPPPHVTITAPGAQLGQVGAAARLAIVASDSGGFALTYAATGLPAGLTINPSTGEISGTPTATATATVNVSASDGRGGTASAVFSWAIAPRPHVTHAKLTAVTRKTARLSVSVSTGSPQIAIKQLLISDPGGPLKFSFSHRALAKAIKASARGAGAEHVTARLPRGRTGVTLSYVSAARGTTSLVLPLKVKRKIGRRRHVRLKVTIVDAAGVKGTSSLQLAL